MNEAAGIWAILIGVMIYFVPTFLASGKRNGGAIFALNLFLGWTLIGWVGALIWALVEKKSEPDKFGRPFMAGPGPCSSMRPEREPVQEPPQTTEIAPRYCLGCGAFIPITSDHCRTCGAEAVRFKSNQTAARVS